MPMRRTLLSVIVPALVAGSAAAALGQGIPTTQPKFLSIVREQVKTGRAAEHARWEAGWPTALEKAKSPYNYLALVSLTGPAEVWYVSPFGSQAAFGEMMALEDRDAALRAELDRLRRGDAEFVSEIRELHAVARPEMSHGTFPDMAAMRFFEITTFRVKPGHAPAFAAAAKAYAAAVGRSASSASWRTYEVVAGAPDGTYLVFSSVPTFADFDKMMTEGEAAMKGLTFEERTTLTKYSTEASLGTTTNRFRVDPGQSYVPAETRQKDPSFWMPKPSGKPSAARKP
jgi:hypothetical protein